MIRITDRIPGVVGKYELTHEDGSVEIVVLKRADEPLVEGTPINKAVLDNISGFNNETTTFNEDGSITVEDIAGNIKNTVFNEDGSITEKFYDIGGEQYHEIQTVFNEDGSISQEVTL